MKITGADISSGSAKSPRKRFFVRTASAKDGLSLKDLLGERRTRRRRRDGVDSNTELGPFGGHCSREIVNPGFRTTVRASLGCADDTGL